jgi:type VII secretion integral membrane protein EccD
MTLPAQQLVPDHRYLADQHCRVTIVGRRKRVDLSVPSRAPIAEYITTVARLCGEPDDLDDEDRTPAWSLTLTGSGLLPPDSSLADAEITDGQVLYLSDARAGENDEPVVTDVAESVTEEVKRTGRLWTSRARATATLCAGASWLVVTIAAAAVVFGRTSTVEPRLLGGMGLVVTIVSVVVAGTARQRSWPLPGWLRTALAASAIPELAAAGALLGSAHDTSVQLAVAAAAGAVLGALLALSAAPGAVTAGLLAFGLLSLAVAGGLAGARANGTQSAAVVAVLALWLYDLAPASIARLVAVTSRVSVQVGEQVRRAQLLVVVWQSVLAVTEALLLSWLAASAQTFALALAGCVAVALLLVAGGYRQLGSVLPAAAGGAVGLLAVILLVPGRLGAPPSTGVVACCAVGVIGVLAGTGWSLSRPAETVPEPAAWRGLLAGLLRIVPIPLVAGVFGAFGHLVTVGRGL